MIKTRTNRVFVGLVNIAGSAVSIANALKSVGINANAFYLSNNKHPYNYEHDKLIWQIERKSNAFLSKLFLNKVTLPIINSSILALSFIPKLFRYNVFIFISKYTFFKSQADLKILRFFGKKICFRFSGCLERNPEENINQIEGGFCRICENLDKQKFCLCNNIERKRSAIQSVEKYADIIFTFNDTKGFLSRQKIQYPNYHIVEKPQNIDLNEKYKSEVVQIAHFPSNKNLKGTKYIEAAINELKENKETLFNYYSKTCTHSELMTRLNTTHILIDQFMHYHGRLAVEAMANGCVVVGQFADWFLLERPELPIIHATPNNIKYVIEQLISNKIELKRIAQKSIDYYEKYHTPKAVGHYLCKTIGIN